MTLHQLRIFESVVRHMNITKAAQTLRISQPSVSQQLKLLEEEFGRKFLIRLNQGVTLTADGKEFFEAAAPMLADADNLEKRFKNSVGNGASLVVGGSHNVSVNVLPKLLRAFGQRYPGVKFVLETDDSSIIERRLLASEVAVALITNPSFDSGISYEPYDSMEVVAFCHPGNPLARKTMALKDLVKYPLIVRRGGRTERMLTHRASPLNVALRCDLSSTVKAAVRAGMGVGILYRNAVASRVARGNLRLIDVPELHEFGIHSFIAYDKRNPLTPMAHEFLCTLRESRNPSIALSQMLTQLDDGRTPLLPHHGAQRSSLAHPQEKRRNDDHTARTAISAEQVLLTGTAQQGPSRGRS
jgi:LysR family transcriptional regulator, low CO2-responsive transcriptional regulator